MSVVVTSSGQRRCACDAGGPLCTAPIAGPDGLCAFCLTDRWCTLRRTEIPPAVEVDESRSQADSRRPSAAAARAFGPARWWVVAITAWFLLFPVALSVAHRWGSSWLVGMGHGAVAVTVANVLTRRRYRGRHRG